MNYLIILAGACIALAALWSIPPLREFTASWLPNPLDDYADRWLGTFLSIGVAILFVLGISGLSAHTPPPCGGPGPDIGDTGPGLPQAIPPSSGRLLIGRVVTRDASGKLTPVTSGKAHLGQNESVLAADGSFQVSLPDSPQPDTLLEIESTHYVSRFVRLDDRALAQRTPIEIESKRRIMVIPAKAADRSSEDDEIRRGMENQFAEDDIELVSDDKQRDEVVDRLYAYQQNGALYDPKTLAKVGNFYGATDGVFWSLIADSDSFTIECRLVNLTTAKVEHTVNPHFRKDASLASAAEAAADLLLSQMAQAVILAPKDTTDVIRNISVRGYTVNIPKSWTLWIAVLPDHNDRLFPQRRLSAHGDQSFYAPDVYAGPETALAQPIRFSVYTVLADPEYSQTIQTYIDSQAQGGLDMNSWDKGRCRLLDHIAVVRRK